MRTVKMLLLLLCIASQAIVWVYGQSPPRALPSKNLPTVYIVGDSTANIHDDGDVSAERRVGWGTPFPKYFDAAKIRVVNAASAGRSSRTFTWLGAH